MASLSGLTVPSSRCCQPAQISIHLTGKNTYPNFVWLITPVSKLLQVTLHSFSCLAGKLDFQWISCMVVTSLALIIFSMFRNLGVLSQKPSSGCVNKPDSSRNDKSSTIEGSMGNPTNLECWSGCSPLQFLEVDTDSSTDPGQAPIRS